jgi:hypothetical protein
MPFGTLKLKAGVDVIETATLNAAQLTSSMCIRFYKGLPEKRGGWSQRSATLIVGQVNFLKGWADLTGTPHLGIGVAGPEQLLLASNVGTISDITPTPAPSNALWSLDNFGQVLIASPDVQGIYEYTPGVSSVATLIATAPTKNHSILVMPQVQIVLALGSETGGNLEPLLIRWSDAGDYTDWIPTATNQAGSYNIPQGSNIVGAIASGLSAIIWTDVGVTAMTYQGLPFVFGFQPIAIGCGLFGRRCKGVIGTRIMWLAGNGNTSQVPIGFFQMMLGASAPQPMECDVWDILIANADFSAADRFFMAVTENYNEFELFFLLKTSSPFYVVNSVLWGSIKYNFVDNAWDYTFSRQLQRTAWESVSPFGNPVGTDIAGLLQQHESGYDANGAGMQWSWQTGDFDLSSGEEIMFVDWLLPDFQTDASPNPPTIVLTVGALKSANSAAITQTETVTPSTDWTANFALRGRQFFIGASGSDVGTFNRLGAIRYRAAVDGRGP